MKLTIRPRPSAFCCDCGERITDETKPRWGGPRCAGCRGLKRPRPGLLPALGLTVAGAFGFALGHDKSTTPPSVLAPTITAVPTSERAPAPPPEPMHPCGAKTKKGTRCKRMVRGEGHCWQHKKVDSRQ